MKKVREASKKVMAKKGLGDESIGCGQRGQVGVGKHIGGFLAERPGAGGVGAAVEKRIQQGLERGGPPGGPGKRKPRAGV